MAVPRQTTLAVHCYFLHLLFRLNLLGVADLSQQLAKYSRIFSGPKTGCEGRHDHKER